MTLYNWLCLFGVPTIVGFIFAWLIKNHNAIKAVKLGIQAMLRDRLIQDYKYYSRIGYADFEARANFENMYTQYHNLGANGVMDDTREKFLALPFKPETKENENEREHLKVD